MLRKSSGVRTLGVSLGLCLGIASTGASTPPEWGNRELDTLNGAYYTSPTDYRITSDGRYCVYCQSVSAREFGLLSYDTTSNRKVLLSFANPWPRSVVEYVLSPDGSTVVFTARSPKLEGDRIYSDGVAGGASTELFTKEPNCSYSFQITADSRYLLVVESFGPSPRIRRLSCVPIDGGSKVYLEESGQSANNIIRYEMTPDGNRIVYTKVPPGESNVVVRSVKPDGSGLVRLGDPGGNTSDYPLDFTISKDSREVAFESEAGLVVSSIDGSTSETLTTGKGDLLQLQFLRENREILYLQSVSEPVFPEGTQQHWEFRIARRSEKDSLLLGYPSAVGSLPPVGAGPGRFFELSVDEGAVYFLHEKHLYRLKTTVPASPQDLSGEHLAREFILASDEGTCIYLDDASRQLRAVFVPGDVPALLSSGGIWGTGHYAVIEPGRTLAFLSGIGTLGVVRWTPSSYSVQIVYDTEPLGDKISFPASGHIIATMAKYSGKADPVLLIDTDAPNATRFIPPIRVARDVNSYAVGKSWGPYAYAESDALFAANSVDSWPWTVASPITTYGMSPNGNYIAYISYEILPFPWPPGSPYLYVSQLCTMPFAGSSANHQQVLDTWASPASVLSGAIAFGEDSLSVNVGPSLTYPVDEFGVPTSTRFRSEAGVAEVLTGGTVPRGEEVVSSRLSADGSARAILARYDGPYAELYVARPPDGVPFKVSGTLRAGYEVEGDYEISPDGLAVMYRANQDTGGVALWISRAPVETVSWILR